ncbi:MAG: hypothetical protein LBQ77_02745 [Treponema sp.]|jgi:hypothetical protein|nr:hypothetical protein [Treponema sp.]
MASQGIKYPVDIVMCIDATGSMSDLIEKVKANALKFYEDLRNKMDEKGKIIDTLRVKVIVFRDYYADGDDAMKISSFFNLPADKEKFDHFVKVITAEGGGDEPESGLEALALAIESDWTKESAKRRHIIVVWTDASTHQLEKKSSKPKNYPLNMAKDFNELTDWWEGNDFVNNSAKRLVLFTPDAYPWTDIATHWTNVINHVSPAGEGLSNVAYEEILDIIANSV